MRSLLFLVLVSMSLMFAGCGTPPERRLESPAVTLTAVTPATVSLQIINLNTVPLVVNRSTHVLFLGGERIGRLDDRNALGVPPLGAVPQTVAVPAALSAGVTAYLAKHPGEIRATVESEFELALSGDDTLTLKAVGAGTVPAR